MQTIKIRNVNDALSQALFSLVNEGQMAESRNGNVLKFPYPVLTEYAKPLERVLFSPRRDANPCFHLMESLWMLAGRKDTRFVAEFVKRMREFSDTGTDLWGAYGWRWREFFGYDQLKWIITELKANPASRRCVLQMWNAFDLLDAKGTEAMDFAPPSDLYVATHGGKDVPCNTAIYFDMRDGRLNMTISNRSNDIVWGAYGANAVHMSMLQEYMALSIGVAVGKMWQFSNDLHLYLDVVPQLDICPLALDAQSHNYYVSETHGIAPVSLLAEGERISQFNADLDTFFQIYDNGGLEAIENFTYETEYFRFVVVPMLNAWLLNKVKERKNAMAEASLIGAPDWRRAMIEWLERRA